MALKKCILIWLIGLLMLCVGFSQAFSVDGSLSGLKGEGYGIQWEMSYETEDWYGARYEGSQPIGDCDNNEDNELLISGRDAMIRVMKWDEELMIYEEPHVLRCPFHPFRRSDAGGMAIGDITRDGENEIAAT